MNEISSILEAALVDEPPTTTQADAIMRRGRAARRRGMMVGSAAVTTGILGAAGVVGAFALSGPTSHPAPAHDRTGSVSIAALAGDATAAPARTRRPATRSTAAVGGVTTSTLPGLVERSIGVGLVDTEASDLGNDINLAAGLAVAGHPYLNVQVVDSGNLITPETCADLNTLGSPDSDGYTGPCSAQTLADGSILIVRSGQTVTGGFAKAQADLIRPDGSGILAEDDNQAMDTSAQVVKDKQAGTLPPVVSPQPALDSSVMATLVEDLAAAQGEK